MDNRFNINEDCRLVREMLALTQAELAEKLGVGIATINRWECDKTEASERNLEALYSYAYQNGIRLNSIIVLRNSSTVKSCLRRPYCCSMVPKTP